MCVDVFIRFICEESLLHLVTSLCQLSEEDMQVVPGKVLYTITAVLLLLIIIVIVLKDICLFPIISLQETCQHNMSRLSSIWNTVTSHITMVATSP